MKKFVIALIVLMLSACTQRFEYEPKAKDEEVDIAIMHGQFHYQFPRIKLDSSHDEQEYLNMVKHYIHIGHIHTHSSYDRIIAQGSFDRIAHGEEENKGCVVAKIDTTNRENDEWMFLVNDKAMRFITLNCPSGLLFMS